MGIQAKLTSILSADTNRGGTRSRVLWLLAAAHLLAAEPAQAGQLDCDPWSQDCGQDEKCMAYAGEGSNQYDSLGCFPVDEGAYETVGDPCTSTIHLYGEDGFDSCGFDAMCLPYNEEGEGTCAAYCTGTAEDPGCAQPGTTCVIAAEGVFNICLPTCDPLLVDCVGDEVCIPNGSSGDFYCALDASGEEGEYGDSCEFINQCNTGLLCVWADHVPGCVGDSCCTPFCDYFEEDVCPGVDQVCTPYFEEGEAPPGLEQVGVCVVM